MTANNYLGVLDISSDKSSDKTFIDKIIGRLINNENNSHQVIISLDFGHGHPLLTCQYNKCSILETMTGNKLLHSGELDSTLPPC